MGMWYHDGCQKSLKSANISLNSELKAWIRFLKPVLNDKVTLLTFDKMKTASCITTIISIKNEKYIYFFPVLSLFIIFQWDPESI